MPDLDPRRRFSQTERAALYLAADGRCQRCGDPLPPGWHADHEQAHATGGATDTANGQALCPHCNTSKGARPVIDLREWQRHARDAFYAKNAPDFLVSATPGAGKTKFALYMANELLAQGAVERIGVIVPTDALRQQWADEAAAAGLSLMPVTTVDDYDKAGYKGFVATYQQLLGAGADSVRRFTRRRVLVLLDEVHHAGDNKSWGEALMRGVELATYRLSLTGTPWRRDARSPIPFVRYDAIGTVIVDYAYEYGEAVSDEVCRRIEFHAYDGEARWTDPGRVKRAPTRYPGGVSVEFTANLGAGMDPDDVSAALDAVYEPKHHWMPSILAQANSLLDDLREEVPDAAGLVVAERQWHAQGYADLILQLTGERPPVVVSDPASDPGGKVAKATIDRFRKGRGRWIVAVKMISEGVDIPRLAVGVYASKTQTPLFFRQVVGRFVRTRLGEEVQAVLLIPAVPDLMRHAREIEEELRHQLDLAEQEERAAQEASGGGDGSQGTLDFRTLTGASEPVFDRAIVGGEEFTPDEVVKAEEECRKLGIPVRYAVNVVPLMRGHTQAAALSAPVRSTETPRHKRESLLRGEIKMLVGRLAYRRGVHPQEVNTELLKAGHPPRSKASVEDLEATRVTIVEWLGDE